MRPPKRTAPPPSRAVMPSSAHAGGVEGGDAIHALRARAETCSWRMRPLVSSALPATTGAARGAGNARRHLGAARAADVRQEALQHGEVRGAVGLQRQRSDRAG